MPSLTSKALLAAIASAASVAAHGHVTNIVINGVSYENYDPFSHPYQADPPTVVGWKTDATDNGFVAPDAFGNSDIVCHRGSANAGGHAIVQAGDSIFIQWDTWPESHKGPVIDYLADCGAGGCETVDKTALDFFKIDEVGLVDGASAPGTWGSDQLIANGNGWMVKIPSDVKPSFYVLRHEIIALHSGGQQNGAQNYPQCINLEITGSGTASPAGVKGTSLYTPSDAGILFNIYQSLTSYPVPGPEVVSGGGSVPQSKSAITASASAVTGGAGSAPSPTGAPASTTGSATSPTSAPAPVESDVSPSISALPEEPVPSPTALPIISSAPSSSPVVSQVPAPTATGKPSCGGGRPGGYKYKGVKKGPRAHPRDITLN